jgi:very-short-patch-repair endonuclease
MISRRSAFARPTLGVVHRVRDLLPQHVVVVDGLRVTTPARVVVDLAATARQKQVERVLDRAWGKRLLALGDVASVLHDVRRKGRRGVRVVEGLVQARVDYVPAETALELAFEDILRTNALAPMRRQVQLSDVEGWVGRVDYFDDDHQLVVFVDGDAWHRALSDARSDAAQQHLLIAAGYRVVRFSEGQIKFRPHAVAARMRELRAVSLAA